VMGAPPQLQVAGGARMSVKEDEIEAELAEGGDGGGASNPSRGSNEIPTTLGC
jgi:hypothetical protein